MQRAEQSSRMRCQPVPIGTCWPILYLILLVMSQLIRAWSWSRTGIGEVDSSPTRKPQVSSQDVNGEGGIVNVALASKMDLAEQERNFDLSAALVLCFETGKHAEPTHREDWETSSGISMHLQATGSGHESGRRTRAVVLPHESI
ncbi:hypothetical protein F5Y15DRAFT_236998 [Xylariaceae sp. FL0016]|nr:hypothetical protein F5Y15DRAFT_236998 [Xylariaceae sp. FL0016]